MKKKAYLFAISLAFIVTLLYALPQVAYGSNGLLPAANTTPSLPNDFRLLALEIITNAPPEADDDFYIINEDTLLSISVPGILENDHDVDRDTLVAMLVTMPSYGSLSLSSDGSFSYIPNLDFFGIDSFTYRANDGTADSNIATVTITVVSVNDAPVGSDDTFSMDENTALTILASDLLSNDYDADGDLLQVLIDSYPSFGTLEALSDQEFVYTPNPDWFGTDSFTYMAFDGVETSAAVQVTITVQEVVDVSTPGFVTGGGWIRDANGNKGHFAFVVQYKPSGDISGIFLYSFSVGKSIYIVKSTEWLEMAIDGNYAYFEAKCSVTKLNLHKCNVVYSDDEYVVRVEVWDNRAKCGKDIFQISIFDTSGQLLYEAGYDPIGYVHGAIVIHTNKHMKMFHCDRGIYAHKHMNRFHCHCGRW